MISSATATVDGLDFALAGLSLQSARRLQVTLEDVAIHKLRKLKGPVTMVRSDHNTRARFFHRLCDAAGVPFICPEEDDPQPIQSQAQADAHKASKARKPGFKANAKLTVAGVELNSDQVRNAETVLAVARSVRFARTSIVLGAWWRRASSNPGRTVATGTFPNLASGAGTSKGIAGHRAASRRASAWTPLDVAACAARS